MRKVRRSPERIASHNEKWQYRYHQRAALRDKYPDEFSALLKEHTYHVALRLIEEAHPDEVEPWVPPSQQGAGRLGCQACGQPFSLHTISAGCP